MRNEFIYHASRAFFASAWADMADESGSDVIKPGTEIMNVMPDEIDPEAIRAAKTLVSGIERINGKPLESLLDLIGDLAEGDRPTTAEYFGHYAAMQSMGHGVGLYDAFGQEVYDVVKIPYIEFGFHSLSKDYFNHE
jgi:hypothetical protein